MTTSASYMELTEKRSVVYQKISKYAKSAEMREKREDIMYSARLRELFLTRSTCSKERKKLGYKKDSNYAVLGSKITPI